MSDKCIDDQRTRTPVIASGGKVWKPPHANRATFTHNKAIRTTVNTLPFSIKEVLFIPLFILLGVLALWLAMFKMVFYISDLREAFDHQAVLTETQQEYKKSLSAWAATEYGYSEIEIASPTTYQARVTTASGDELEIGYIEYKNLPVLYETPEQLSERTAAIDAGTYSEELIAAVDKRAERLEEVKSELEAKKN